VSADFVFFDTSELAGPVRQVSSVEITAHRPLPVSLAGQPPLNSTIDRSQLRVVSRPGVYGDAAGATT
jgi:hypothetical protein